jgi:hypothetical protein
MIKRHYLALAGGGIALAASVIVVASFLATIQQPDNNNVDMIGNGKDTSNVQTSTVEYLSGASGDF